MVSNLYILGDADHVREKIEFYLLSSQLNSLRIFSKSLRIAVDDLAQRVQDVFAGDIIMVGGDDVLFYVPKE